MKRRVGILVLAQKRSSIGGQICLTVMNQPARVTEQMNLGICSTRFCDQAIQVVG